MWTVVVGGIAVWLAVLLVAMAMGKRAAKPWPGDAEFAPPETPKPPVVGQVVKVERVDATRKDVTLLKADGTMQVIRVRAPEVSDIRPGQWAAVRKVHPND